MNSKMRNVASTMVHQQQEIVDDAFQKIKQKSEALGDAFPPFVKPKWARRSSMAKSAAAPLITRSARSWDVRMPPFKKCMVSGRLVPSLRRLSFFAQKHRKISLEVKGTRLQRDATKFNHTEGEPLRDQDFVVVSILRLVNATPGDELEDDQTDNGYSTDYSKASLSAIDEAVKWKARAQYKLEDITILKLSGNVCEIRLGSGNDIVVRDINFESETHAVEFEDALKAMKVLEMERAQRQTSVFRDGPGERGSRWISNNKLKEEFQDIKRISLLVEIVSAANLRPADAGATDPYVIVRMGGKEIHRTEFVSRTTDPIWTLDHSNIFLMEMSPEEFFSCAGGMSFTVKDYDAFGSNPLMGQVTVSLHTLLEGEGKRSSYPLVAKGTATDEDNGKLYLRFKRASESDIEFMKAFSNNKKKAELYLSETYLPLRLPKSKVLKGQKKRGSNCESLLRVKPFPDPKREEETKWMSKEEIEAESLKPSTHWIEAGSGDLFRVFFELIGADGLPNMDATTLNILDKSDTFANIAFEDALVNTDVISNSLSPRWMPWCYRAFAFNVSHPSSDILLSLFDYDPELSPAQLLTRAASDLHDRIGRVRINLAKFLPDTVYNLTYPLFLGGEIGKHRLGDRGTVHVRLRIESNNARKVVIKGLLPPKQSYLAVARQIDFEVSHFTVLGASASGLDKFSMPRFTSYIEELQSYEMVQESVLQAVLTVWLWRGHCKVTWREKKFMLPLHSMIAYFWSILVTWNFSYMPSFLFFCIAWIMLASNEQMNKHPSRWHQSRGYLSFLRLLIFNATSCERIDANENLEEINAFEGESENHLERWKRRKLHNRAAKKMLKSELRDQIGQAREDIDITTSKGGLLKGGVTVNPLNAILFPIQKRLRRVVIGMRIGKSIFLWEETYYAFWITTFALAASMVSLFLPWDIMVRWTLRVLAWLLLGPWMRLVDRYHFRDDVVGSGHDTDQWNKRWQRRYNRIHRKARKKRIRKEDALKLKAMMRFCFGKYLVSIPRFNEDLYRDKPLPASFAAPYDAASEEPIEIAEKKYGQKLAGTMVMKRELQINVEAMQVAKSEASKKKRTRRRASRSRNSRIELNDTTSVDPSLQSNISDQPIARKVSFDASEMTDVSEKAPQRPRIRKNSRDAPSRGWSRSRREPASNDACALSFVAPEEVHLLVPLDPNGERDIAPPLNVGLPNKDSESPGDNSTKAEGEFEVSSSDESDASSSIGSWTATGATRENLIRSDPVPTSKT